VGKNLNSVEWMRGETWSGEGRVWTGAETESADLGRVACEGHPLFVMVGDGWSGELRRGCCERPGRSNSRGNLLCGSTIRSRE